MASDDSMHVQANLNFEYFSANDISLLSCSYVLIETMAPLQQRIGMEAAADFQAKIQPLLEMIWVDNKWHDRAVQRLFASWKKDVSLVDCLSFEIMEARDLQTAFTFDKHIEENGFTLAAIHGLNQNNSM